LRSSFTLRRAGKIKIIDTLGDEEQQALLKIIDLAISNKRMKDNLQQMIIQ
jgi:hypothetical protein